MSQEDAPAEAPEAAAATSEPKAQEAGFASLPAETQAEIKRLRAEAASNRKAAQEAAAKVEEYEAANASEIEKANKRAEKAETTAAEANAKLVRYEVATEKQVPADAVELLTGTTREELEAQADRILSLAKHSQPAPEFDGGAREPAPESKSPEQAHNDLIIGMFGGVNQNNT